MQAVNKRILIKAANLYYTDGVKQGEIAGRLGVDRTTVSKYLKLCGGGADAPRERGLRPARRRPESVDSDLHVNRRCGARDASPSARRRGASSRGRLSSYAAPSSACHTMNGMFPHVNPGEMFVLLGVANGITTLGLPYTDLALRYLLVGLLVNFLRGWLTDFTVAYVQRQLGVKLSKEPAVIKS